MNKSRTFGLSRPGLLLFTFAASITVGSSLFGQAPVVPPDVGPTPSTTAQAPAVIVTGSNIPTAEEVGPNPVDVYNRDYINKSGERTTEQFLQSIPAVNANVVPISNNENGSNTAVGAAT